MTLNELAQKHSTDKRYGKHGYTRIYEPLFANRNISNLLEIGVYNGGSHLMWLEYFPEAVIHGIDISENYLNRLKIRSEDNPRLRIAKVDQSSRSELLDYANSLSTTLDVVIDDGSHKCSHQIISFDTLWPFVSSGGLYVIEDVFTSYWPGSKHGYVDQDLTCVEYFKSMVDKLNLVPEGIRVNRGYNDYYSLKKAKTLSTIQHTVDSIQFRSGMIIICKRD